ncbi:MAG: hypothetical protein V3U64_05565 [Cocleimonas sp.]
MKQKNTVILANASIHFNRNNTVNMDSGIHQNDELFSSPKNGDIIELSI